MTHQVQVQITPTDQPNRSEIENTVDEDIRQFDLFFQKALRNDPMIGAEKAIIKTYLAYKLGIARANEEGTPSSEQ